MKKNPQTKKDTFWIADFYGVMRTQSPTCTEISSMANPKIADMLLCFQILCIYRPLKKHAYFDRKFIKF